MEFGLKEIITLALTFSIIGVMAFIMPKREEKTPNEKYGEIAIWVALIGLVLVTINMHPTCAAVGG